MLILFQSPYKKVIENCLRSPTKNYRDISSFIVHYIYCNNDSNRRISHCRRKIAPPEKERVAIKLWATNTTQSITEYGLGLFPMIHANKSKLPCCTFPSSLSLPHPHHIPGTRTRITTGKYAASHTLAIPKLCLFSRRAQLPSSPFGS